MLFDALNQKVVLQLHRLRKSPNLSLDRPQQRLVLSGQVLFKRSNLLPQGGQTGLMRLQVRGNQVLNHLPHTS